MYENEQNQTPYLAGFLADSKIKRDKIIKLMNENYIPTTQWPDLAPEIYQNPTEHKIAIDLTNQGIFLPVHNSINEKYFKNYYKNNINSKFDNLRVKELNIFEWNEYYNSCQENNLIQSWEYGEAKCESENSQPIRLLIFNDKKSIIGIAQVIFKRIPFVGFVCRMNRGPLLLGNDYKNVEFKIKIILCIINYLKNKTA